MKLEAVGLPAALKAWRDRTPEPVLTMACGVSGCDAEVGAVYRSPKGPVVESRMHPREDPDAPAGPAPEVPDELAGLAAGLGVTGLTEEFTGADGRGTWLEQPVRAQVDLLRSELYWQDPKPACPQHGELRIDREELAGVVRAGGSRYDTTPA